MGNSHFRLRSHPQVRVAEVVVKARVFTCPRCRRDYLLGRGDLLVDGTLVCWSCFRPDERHDLLRCVDCGRMLPQDEFLPPPRGMERNIRCRTCRAPAKRTQPCQRCGESFEPTRSDARYCSGRCRVAAHRKQAKA